MQLLEGRLTVEDLDAVVAAITEIGEAHGATVQAFDARYVADRRHLERAVALADRAIDRGENVARDRAVEILLYAAGRRQIDRALAMGVSEGENEAVILIDDGETGGTERSGDGETGAIAALERDLDFEPAPTLAEPDESILTDFFEITDPERRATDATLAELVRERVALLEVEK